MVGSRPWYQSDGNTDKYGFPKSYRRRQKQFFGYETEDMVAANVPSGKYKDRFAGRVALQSSGY